MKSQCYGFGIDYKITIGCMLYIMMTIFYRRISPFETIANNYVFENTNISVISHPLLYGYCYTKDSIYSPLCI